MEIGPQAPSPRGLTARGGGHTKQNPTRRAAPVSGVRQQKGYPMRTSEVLNRAADLIEERGWAVGVGWDGDGETLCIEGGIAAAMGERGGPGYRCSAYSAVCAYLDRRESGLWAWNDRLIWEMPEWKLYGDVLAARGAAARYVIEVLRACAVIEAAREDQDAAEATYAPNLAAVSA